MANNRKPVFDLKVKPDNGIVETLSRETSDKISLAMQAKFKERLDHSRSEYPRVFRQLAGLTLTE